VNGHLASCNFLRGLFFFATQAYQLAGLLIVPVSQLVAVFEEAANAAFRAGVDVRDLSREEAVHLMRRSVGHSTSRPKSLPVD
jgi:hypothetical protein